MAKKKKTRRQKELADIRRRRAGTHLKPDQTSPVTAPTYSLEQKTSVPPVQPIAHSIATSSYRYLSSDLLKTLILTCSIIVVEILLRFLVKG